MPPAAAAAAGAAAGGPQGQPGQQQQQRGGFVQVRQPGLQRGGWITCGPCAAGTPAACRRGVAAGHHSPVSQPVAALPCTLFSSQGLMRMLMMYYM